MREKKLTTDQAVLKKLKQLGLPVSPDNRFVSAAKLETTIAQFTAEKENVTMPVDGLVLKVDDLELRERQGFTANNPRWATSLKFEPELGETTVEDIELQVGRTGRVTPPRPTQSRAAGRDHGQLRDPAQRRLYQKARSPYRFAGESFEARRNHSGGRRSRGSR